MIGIITAFIAFVNLGYVIYLTNHETTNREAKLELSKKISLTCLIISMFSWIV